MDLNILFQIIIGPVIAFILSTVKNKNSVASLKKSVPIIESAISALTQLRDAINGKPVNIRLIAAFHAKLKKAA